MPPSSCHRCDEYSRPKVPKVVVFGNSLMGGVWSRAWYNTSIDDDRKHFFVVDGGHFEVQSTDLSGMDLPQTHYAPYFELTMAAIESGFQAEPHSETVWNGLDDMAGTDISWAFNSSFFTSHLSPRDWVEASIEAWAVEIVLLVL